MAERPIFVPTPDCPELVKEIFFSMKWHSGFAPAQKEKNIKALHDAAEVAGYRNVLEVSTKSPNQRGQHLSAFYLKVKNERLGEIPLECAFQGSKVFERGGPFTDLYKMDVREAKKDTRLKESGPLKGFCFDGIDFPLEPKTAFYDWLYVNCIYPYRDWAVKLYDYRAFTDIEFNPHRSINCQARSIALFVSLMKLNLLDEAVKSPSDFINLLLRFAYRPKLRTDESTQPALFSPRQ
jgi:hypothetical protein